VGLIFFALPQLAEAAPDFLFGVFADGAGVVEDDVGVVAILDGFVALDAELAEDELAVEHVHLAAEGFEIELAGHRCRGRLGSGTFGSGSGFVESNPGRRFQLRTRRGDEFSIKWLA
jgi:hypothetical protein